MTIATNSHLELDEKGRLRIAGHGLPVDYIIAEHVKGATAEQMTQDYWPYLKLAELYAALAYYYDHKSEIDERIDAETREFDRLRAEAIASGKQPTRAELEGRLREREFRK